MYLVFHGDQTETAKTLIPWDSLPVSSRVAQTFDAEIVIAHGQSREGFSVGRYWNH
jgi:hypothetical protein